MNVFYSSRVKRGTLVQSTPVSCWTVGRISNGTLPVTVVHLVNHHLCCLSKQPLGPEHSVQKFLRVLIGDSLFYSCQYNRIKSRNSYTISYILDGSEGLGQIQYFISIHDTVFAVIRTLKSVPETCQSFFQLPHCALDLVPCIVPVIYAELAVVPIVGIVKKAVFMDISSKLYVAKFPNNIKDD